MNVDFLPERIRSGRARKRRLILQGYVLVATVAILVCAGYFNHRRVVSTSERLQQLQGRSVHMNQQLTQLAKLQEGLSGLLLKQQIDNSLGSRVNATDVLGELGRILPENMSLTDLCLEAQDISMPFQPATGGTAASVRPVGGMATNSKQTVKRVRLLITGLSSDNVSVANFIAALSASPLFEDVNMGYSRNVELHGRSAKQFQANCYVVR